VVDKADLTVGAPYYICAFHDQELGIPKIETYIYVGQDLFDDDRGSRGSGWYFQDPVSYLEHGSFVGPSDASECELFRADEKTAELFCDLSELIARLSEIEPAR
jgi:hypothetical protein